MELYLVRHGIAAERKPGLKDQDRSLTPKGRKKAECVAKRLKALGVRFDLILSSPLLRARQTAEILAEEVPYQGKVSCSDLLRPGSDLLVILKELQKYSKAHTRVALVGHEPDLSFLASLLISGKPGLGLEIKKVAVCQLQIDRFTSLPCATLVWLCPPKVFGAD